MYFLRITNGTKKHVPMEMVVSVTTAADVGLVRGKITAVKYMDGAAAAVVTVTSDTVAAYNGANALYEVGCLTIDGAFTTHMSN